MTAGSLTVTSAGIGGLTAETGAASDGGRLGVVRETGDCSMGGCCFSMVSEDFSLLASCQEGTTGVATGAVGNCFLKKQQ